MEPGGTMEDRRRQVMTARQGRQGETMRQVVLTFKESLNKATPEEIRETVQLGVRRLSKKMKSVLCTKTA